MVVTTVVEDPAPIVYVRVLSASPTLLRLGLDAPVLSGTPVLRGTAPVLRGAPLGTTPVPLGKGALNGIPEGLLPVLKGASPGASELPEAVGNE